MEEEDKQAIARRAWLARLVARLRGDRSQQEFADLLGVTRQTIGDYTGRNENRGMLADTDPAGIDIAYWSAFAQMSGVSVDELYQAMLDESQEVAPDPKQIDRSLLRRLVSASIPTKLAVLQMISKFFVKPEAIAAAEVFEPAQSDQVVQQKAKLISDLALSLISKSSDSSRFYVTEAHYWVVKEDVLVEFRRSLADAIERERLEDIVKLGQFSSAEEVLSLLNGDRQPVVPDDLEKLSGYLNRADGKPYTNEELLDLFEVPEKARPAKRQLNELGIII